MDIMMASSFTKHNPDSRILDAQLYLSRGSSAQTHDSGQRKKLFSPQLLKFQREGIKN